MRLLKYKKPESVYLNRVQTTVSIEKLHLDFIKSENLNLSEFVRDCIETLKKRYDRGLSKKQGD
jgi:hypothetical protein